MRSKIVIVLACLLGLGALSAPTAAAAPPERGADETKSVIVNLEFIHHEGVSTLSTYRCTTGTFAPFVDLDGWIPRLITWTQTDAPSPPREVYKDILGEAPYDDAYSTGGVSYAAAPGTHHAQLPSFPQIDSGPDGPETRQMCGQQVAKEQAQYGTTAVVHYVRDSDCSTAYGRLDEAKKGVKAATKAVRNAEGKQEKAAAKAKLKAAKAKLKKAKKKQKQACPT